MIPASVFRWLSHIVIFVLSSGSTLQDKPDKQAQISALYTCKHFAVSGNKQTEQQATFQLCGSTQIMKYV